MHRHRLVLAVLACVLGPASMTRAQGQVTQDSFLVRTTGDLVALCASAPSDRLYTAAQNFCQGFVVGVYRTIEAEQAARRVKLFCPAGPPPSRNEGIANFVRWAQASPTRLATAPTDGIAAFLAERLPCRSASR